MLLIIVTSSSNFLSKEDLLYFLSAQFSLVMTMVTLITFPARSVKLYHGCKIYPSLYIYAQSHYIIMTKHANNAKLPKF